MAISSSGNGFCLLLLAASFFRILNAQSDTDTYLGCYEEVGQFSTFFYSYSSQNTTPDDCREHCRNKNLTFAWLSGGSSCGCPEPNQLGPSIFEKLDNSRCDMSCAGDRSRVCGGAKNSAIYSIYSSCPKGKWGNKHCNQNCNCKNNRSCSVLGLCPDKECGSGWKLKSINNRETCTSDVDECEAECSSTKTTDCHNCNSTNGEVCNNIAGSFHCICRSGFVKENGKCIDTDECSLNQSRCNQRCVNTIGGYTCSCFAGYELRDEFNCYDINECERDNPCHHFCMNNVGSYSCGCLDGLYLAEDSKTCLTVDKATAFKIGSGIGHGIQAIIIIVLVIILLKRRQPQGREKSKTVEGRDLKEYASLSVAADKSESAYTAIRNLPSDDYKNFEPTYNIVPETN